MKLRFFLALGLLTGWLFSPLFAAVCPQCGGSGKVQTTCPDCGGSGISGWTTVNGAPGAYGCETCGGVRGNPVYGGGQQGRGYIEETCPTCGGTGQVDDPPAPGGELVPSPAAPTAPAPDKGQEEKQKAEFEKNKAQALTELKTLELKNYQPQSGLKLKTLDEMVGCPVDLRKIGVPKGTPNPDQFRREMVGTLPEKIEKRTLTPNPQVLGIMKSLKIKEPPSPIKPLKDLQAGDVILVAPVKLNGSKDLWDVAVSNTIRWADSYASNWSSPASHAAIYLGEKNGRRWYLDNTSHPGPVIKEESQFLKEYGARQMDVATLVGQPLSPAEGDRLWQGAHELRETKKYGIWSDDRMVCSEAARWELVRAGRTVPETAGPDKAPGFGKSTFVKFSPADFYHNEQYFLIHRLGIPGKN